MYKKLALTGMIFLMSTACLVTSAYEIGERSSKLFNESFDYTKHNLHLVVVQKIDMSEILSADAFQQLKPSQRVRYNRFEYNETSALSAERQTTYDGTGRIIKDINCFAKGGNWYSIDYINETYDRLPELPGMVRNFRDSLAAYFTDSMPEGGFDEFTGYDYDRRYKSDKEIYFYFDKDTDKFRGYEISGNPRFNVMEFNDQVNVERAFALPPEDYRRQANESMRAYATKLVGAAHPKKK